MSNTVYMFSSMFPRAGEEEITSELSKEDIVELCKRFKVSGKKDFQNYQGELATFERYIKDWESNKVYPLMFPTYKIRFFQLLLSKESVDACIDLDD